LKRKKKKKRVGGGGPRKGGGVAGKRNSKEKKGLRMGEKKRGKKKPYVKKMFHPWLERKKKLAEVGPKNGLEKKGSSEEKEKSPHVGGQ